ncbi:hypothetical protein [Desulfatibacillum aliphaticivorans]|uniref:hypothetical protein n=1 Tax=Desulfatibacillum aliphaticivorans TaxID=218208 RepID=UPI0004038BF1|nr:hypothetical protein [Desulfatibacillum aliphaticivorans]
MTQFPAQSEKVISIDPIRISLYRMHPKHEESVLKRFETKLNGNFVAFKGLGHFDVIVVYRVAHHENDSLLFSGTIDGIRSFSNIDCVYLGSNGEENIIETLEKRRVIALNLIALHSDAIKNYGGIYSNLFQDGSKSMFYLNSLTWGEQVIILADENMGSLAEKIEEKVLFHTSKFIDIHTVLGVNLDEVAKIDGDTSDWEENIQENVSLKWLIDLECKADAEKVFHKSLEAQARSTSSAFSFSGPKRSFARRTLVYDLNAATWGQAIKGIRKVRQEAAEYFSSTKLLVRANGEMKACSSGPTPEGRFEPERPKRIKITGSQCKEIKENMGLNVGRQVIQAAYSVLDTAWDSPSDYAVSSLMPAVKKLLQETTQKTHTTNYAAESIPRLDEDQRKLPRLTEAERLMSATRQRMAGMPITREFSRVPFELPPPGPRLYYEAAEHVADCFLRCVNKTTDSSKKIGPPDSEASSGENYSPYVLIDTVDSPQFSGLAIALPYRQLLVPHMYEAITHECLHFHVGETENWKRILGSQEFKDFYRKGRISSFRGQTESERLRQLLVEDIAVESLDFVFSYLENLAMYVNEEWSFFYKLFDQSIGTVILPKTLLPYILRTLSVSIQHEARKMQKNSRKASLVLCLKGIIANKHQLRSLIKQHIENIKDIFSGDEKLKIINNLPPSIVVDLQHDIERLESLLCAIFNEVNGLKEEKMEVLQGMRDFTEMDVKGIITAIMNRRIVSESIQFPHIVVNNLSYWINTMESKHSDDGLPDPMDDYGNNSKETEARAKALVMSLWNSFQLSQCNRAGSEKEKPK